MDSGKHATTIRRVGALAKRPAVAVALGTTVALSAIYGLGKSIRWVDPGPGVPPAVSPQGKAVVAAASGTGHRREFLEALVAADARFEEAAATGTAVCRAALFCDARKLYLRARTVLDARGDCEAHCAEVKAGIELRATYAEARIRELSKKSAALRHASAAASAAACADDDGDACDCISALQTIDCQ